MNIEALRSSAHATSVVALQIPCSGSAWHYIPCHYRLVRMPAWEGARTRRGAARDAHVVALKRQLYTWRLVIRETSHKPLQDATPGTELLGGQTAAVVVLSAQVPGCFSRGSQLRHHRVVKLSCYHFLALGHRCHDECWLVNVGAISRRLSSPIAVWHACNMCAIFYSSRISASAGCRAMKLVRHSSAIHEIRCYIRKQRTSHQSCSEQRRHTQAQRPLIAHMLETLCSVARQRA